MLKFLDTLHFYFLKVVNFFKKYHIYIAFGVLLLVGLLTESNRRKMLSKLNQKLEVEMKRHNKEVQELEDLRRKELEKYNEIDRKYKETIQHIENEHKEALETLDRQKKQELKKIVENYNDDPDMMAQRVNELFNIEIYK